MPVIDCVCIRVLERVDIIMDFTFQFTRLVSHLKEESKIFFVSSYRMIALILQISFCVVAIIATWIWIGFGKLIVEIDAMNARAEVERKKNPPKKKQQWDGR